MRFPWFLGFLLQACSPAGIGERGMQWKAARYGLTAGTFAQEGTQLRFWTGGEGPPLLLLHGFGGTGLSTWLPQLVLSDAHTLLIPDLLWFGESDSSSPPTLSAQVEILLAWMDSLALEKADVAAVSYGGFVALQMAEERPEIVGKVVLVDSPGPFFSPEDQQAFCERIGVESPAELFIPDTAEGVQRLLRVALADPPRLPKWVARDLLGSYLSAHPEEQEALLDELVQMRAEMDVDAVPMPPEMLVIWGEDDPIFPVPIAEKLAAHAGAELHVFPGAAHTPSIDTPKAFNAVVRRFLREE
jgi:pimeloyl-ACP methyl ester carboxylesterase